MNGTLAALPSSLFFKSNNHSLSSVSFPRRAAIKSAVQTCSENSTRRSSKPASSLYELLRVSQSATPAQIKSAYRTLAKTYHPDASSSSSDSREFIAINEAYLTLADPTSRAMYDMKLVYSGNGYSGRVERSGSYPAVRRWETDQCW